MGQIPNIGLRSQGGRQMNDFNGEDTSGGRDKGNLAQGIREGREQLLSILSAMARNQDTQRKLLMRKIYKCEEE
ncbi:MAG: hypothetical protein Q9205_002036 [Flavoplaca limonia]